jgi:hypothetical protein
MINFHRVGIDTRTLTRTLTIKNVNKGILAGGVDLSGVTTPFIASGAGPFSLAHKQTTKVVVKFAPTAPGRFSGTIAISSTDPNTPFVNVPVLGRGLAGRLETSKALRFGRVRSGQTSTRTLTIRNGGAGLLHGNVNGNVLGAFSVVSGSGRFALPRGQTQRIKLRFAPIASAKFNATLLITSDDPSHASVAVRLTGTGT